MHNLHIAQVEPLSCSDKIIPKLQHPPDVKPSDFNLYEIIFEKMITYWVIKDLVAASTCKVLQGFHKCMKWWYKPVTKWKTHGKKNN